MTTVAIVYHSGYGHTAVLADKVAQGVRDAGQTPVLRYNRQLMQAILHDRLPIADIVNATIIPLDEAPQGYASFDSGVAKKFVLDPHGLLAS